MKKLTALFIFCIAGITTLAQDNVANQNEKPGNQIRQYWFILLKKGSTRSQDSATAAKIQQAHLANINRLYQEGIIKVAGPFGDDGEWRGIFIFDCPTKEDAEKYLQTDPAVKAGRLSYEIHPWWTMPTGSFVPGKPKPE